MSRSTVPVGAASRFCVSSSGAAELGAQKVSRAPGAEEAEMLAGGAGESWKGPTWHHSLLPGSSEHLAIDVLDGKG